MIPGRMLLFLAALAGCCQAACAAEAARPKFNYQDVDRFAATLQAIDAGAKAEAALAAYLSGASPAYPSFAERHDVTAQSIAAAIARRPNHYHRVARMKSSLRRHERAIVRALERLGRMAPGHIPAPIYYLVGDLTVGGTPSELRPASDGGPRFGIAVAVEAIAMDRQTDMKEFPGTYGGGYLVDIPYVVVHEMVHVYQVQAQGLDNYRSIYRPGPNNINLALAVREGCADYLTRLATGKSRTGNQQSYGLAHERELWSRFRQIMDQPASFADGWFGALDPKTPDWPPQIGYWLGMRMCESYHRSAADPREAIRHILSDYAVADMRKYAESYARQMGD